MKIIINGDYNLKQVITLMQFANKMFPTLSINPKKLTLGSQLRSLCVIMMVIY